MKNVIRNIKWVALLTFALGYVVATAMAGPESGIFAPGTLHPLDNSTETKTDAKWKPVDVSNSLPAYFTGKRPNVVNRPETLNRVFDILCKSGRPLRVMQIGDSHVAAGDYPQAVRHTLEAAWGRAENDTAASGLVYTYEGSNGATTQRFATSDRIQKIANKRPDLIILSFGTNECHSMKYREEIHREQLEKFYGMLTGACPEAVILMTTPPGDCLTTRSVRYGSKGEGQKKRRVVSRNTSVNPMTTRCAAELEEFGIAHNLPVWDLNTLAGGADAVRTWRAGNLMKPDRIHFTPQGYTLHGRLLGEAILTAYNAYLQG